ncbi:Uclacyanin 1, partial [Bienertia sinuspersici]
LSHHVATIDEDRNHIVGGATGWEVNSDLDGWSASSTFMLGDNLIFYIGDNHTVTEVMLEDDYNNCVADSRTDMDVVVEQDHTARIPLLTSGWHYFICGTLSLCKEGVKVKVFVSDHQRNETTSITDNQMNGTDSQRNGMNSHITFIGRF